MTDDAQALVGRDRELDMLTRLLEEAKAGEPRFAQVSGEPGIGKTFLLAELGRRADADGWLVLSGRSAELEREMPFGLVIDAFDAYLASLDPQTFERIAPDEMSELAGLFPSLRSLVPAPAQPATPAERFRAHRAVVEMIERLAARQPVLLLLDDLHWADGASLEQAAYVLRRPPDAAVVIVGSFRAGQASPALVKAVTAASRERPIEFLELGPLEAQAAGQLVGDGLDRDLLYEQSGGNPYYLLQLARMGGNSGPGAYPESVPRAVAASIAAELESLSEPACRLANAAAVAGDPFELDLAAVAAGVSEQEALQAIDELIARDLIRPTAVPRTFQFRHPLARSAVYEAGAPGARLAAHERAAKALAARSAPAAELAHHVEHAARRGDLAAVGILREAGEATVARAPRTAARWFAAALRILPEGAHEEERLGLLLSLAGARAAIGQLEESHSALLLAMELAGPDGPVPRVRLISGCAGIEQLLGRTDKAHRRLAAALEELSDPGSSDACALMIDLAVAAFYRGDYEEMADWGARACHVARGLDEPPLCAAAIAATSFARSCAGPIAEAHSLRDEAGALVDRLDDETIGRRLDAVAWLSSAEFYTDRYEDSERHARRGLELARATGQGELVPALTQALANVLFMSGRPAEAGELLEEAVDAARLTDNAVGLAWSLLNRSYAAVNEGDTATALATGEEAYELTRPLAGSPVNAWAGATYGAALLDADRPQEAAEVLEERAGGTDAPRIPGAWRANWLDWMTRALLATGRDEEAAESAGLAEARAEEFGLDVAWAGAKRAGAAVALSGGDPAGAAEAALNSAEHADRTGAVIESGQSRLLAGRALVENGETERAAEVFERAAADFDRSGAVRRRNMVEQELGKLGRRVHRRTRAGVGEGVDSLTGRELEVARLVVDRRTNPEIATELFLSIKTVETHMRNIFRKLDVASRVEVARAVERHESD